MKKIILIVSIMIAIVIGFVVISNEDEQIKQSVYATLEKETLTEDEKEFVKFATDPAEMKESYIPLDEEHIQLYQKHFGKN